MADINHIDPDETIQPLPQDGATPFSQPNDVEENLSLNNAKDVDHPAFDSGDDIDDTEAYNEGLSEAAGSTEPNKDNAVTGYDPKEDIREHPELLDEKDVTL